MDVAGAVLTGGTSRRMGRDKATLEIDGVAMARRVADALIAAGCAPVVAVGGDATRLGAIGIPVVDDDWPGEGPLGGIITALRHSERAAVVVAACDLPWLDAPTIERLVATAVARFGSIDILVNNAVVRHFAPVEQLTPAEWEQSLAVNLSAPFHLVRLVLPMMRARSFGRIVNLSSYYGVRGAENRIGYVTTKTALIGMTLAIALEAGDMDITCNAICPGPCRRRTSWGASDSSPPRRRSARTKRYGSISQAAGRPGASSRRRAWRA